MYIFYSCRHPHCFLLWHLFPLTGLTVDLHTVRYDSATFISCMTWSHWLPQQLASSNAVLVERIVTVALKLYLNVFISCFSHKQSINNTEQCEVYIIRCIRFTHLKGNDVSTWPNSKRFSGSFKVLDFLTMAVHSHSRLILAQGLSPILDVILCTEESNSENLTVTVFRVLDLPLTTLLRHSWV